MINNSKMRKAIQEFVNKYTHIEINKKNIRRFILSQIWVWIFERSF